MNRCVAWCMVGAWLGTMACGQDVDVGTVKPGDVAGGSSSSGSTSSSSMSPSSSSSSSSSGGGMCPQDACGPVPSVAPPQVCADGSMEDVSVTCQPGAGACGWVILRSGCPNEGRPCMSELDCNSGEACVNGTCSPVTGACTREACGPVPPVAPPMTCADGSEEPISITCEGANGMCAWNVQRGCPQDPVPCMMDMECGMGEQCINGACGPSSTCPAEACGPPPPVAPPMTCADGSEEPISITCEGINGMCAWNVQRGCPQDPVTCMTDEACAADEQCINGTCAPSMLACDPMSCGIQPAVMPGTCSDGSMELVEVTCEPLHGACAWTVNRTCLPPPCMTDMECAMGEQCINGVCGPSSMCPREACGPVPPVAPPMTCADGSEEPISITCEGANGMCAWNIQRGCPEVPVPCMTDTECAADEQCINGACAPSMLVCDPMSCGIQPAVMPGTCSDGSMETVEVMCEPRHTGCAWTVNRTCPPPPCMTDMECAMGEQCINGVCGPSSMCPREACGPVPPVAPPMTCADGSEEPISITCEGANGMCAWNIQRGCPEMPVPCMTDMECGMGEQCINGACGPSSICPAEACGPPPPVAPPMMCADGSTEDVSVTCEPVNGQCEWNVDRSCPTTQACMDSSVCPMGQSCINGVCG